MGCCGSSPDSPQVAATPNGDKQSRIVLSTRDIIPSVPSIKNQSNAADYRGLLPGSFEKLVAGVKTIANPANMLPVLCLTLDAFPVVLTSIQIDEQSTCLINLPIIAASFSQMGKVVVFSQFAYLSQESFSNGNTINILINAINWASGGSLTNPTVLVYSDQFDLINSAMKELGFQATKCYKIENTDFSKYRVLIITSEMQLDEYQDVIIQASSNGCGIMVFYTSKSTNLGINSFLQNYGLSFGELTLNDDNFDNPAIQVNSNFNSTKDINFVAIYIKLVSLLLQNKVELSILDDTIANIRYYIPACDIMQAQQLIDIVHKSFNFLDKTNYRDSEGICRTSEQKILVILMQQIFQKLPVTSLPDIKCADLFPGETKVDEFVDVEISLEVGEMRWATTGLWLPPHKIATLSMKKIVPGVFVQIGSHTESIYALQGVWKRWPLPCVTFPISQRHTKILTPFGGIVYLCATFKEAKTIDFKVSGCCNYPRFSYTSPEILQETKEVDVPWAEIEAPNIIFTLPTPKFREITDFGPLCEKMATFFHIISQVLPFRKKFQARVVFDVQLPDDQAVCGYPIVDKIEKIDKILIEGVKGQTFELFSMLTLVSLLLIEEKIFRKEEEVLFAQFAAAKALKFVFSEFDKEAAKQVLTLHFNELWEIDQKFGNNLVSNALQQLYEGSANRSAGNKSRNCGSGNSSSGNCGSGNEGSSGNINEGSSGNGKDGKYKNGDNNWAAFVSILSINAKRNFFSAFGIIDGVPPDIKKLKVFSFEG